MVAQHGLVLVVDVLDVLIVVSLTGGGSLRWCGVLTLFSMYPATCLYLAHDLGLHCSTFVGP